MLIGLKRKFVFVANLKTASSAIEAVLRPLSEIAITDSQFGKHLTFADIERRFSWVFEHIPRQELFVFGIMRDPVDFIVSLYNSHANADFKFMHPHLYTGAMDFDQFISRWCDDNRDQIGPQYLKFLDRDGGIAPDLIISYRRLAKGLDYVASRIDAPALRTMPTINVSQGFLSRYRLSRQQRAWIADTYAGDRRFIERFCDHLLTAEERGDWQNGITGYAPSPARQIFGFVSPSPRRYSADKRSPCPDVVMAKPEQNDD
jgi:hypothetical protein